MHLKLNIRFVTIVTDGPTLPEYIKTGHQVCFYYKQKLPADIYPMTRSSFTNQRQILFSPPRYIWT